MMELGSGGVGKAMTAVIETPCFGHISITEHGKEGIMRRRRREGVHRINDYDLLNHPYV